MSLKYHLKFYGKLVTYLAIILAVDGIVTANFIYTASGILFVIAGCAIHEYSE